MDDRQETLEALALTPMPDGGQQIIFPGTHTVLRLARRGERDVAHLTTPSWCSHQDVMRPEPVAAYETWLADVLFDRYYRARLDMRFLEEQSSLLREYVLLSELAAEDAC